MSHGVFVANSSPLIAFERLGKLALLQRLTSILFVPSAVRREVFGPRDLPAWIVERPISSLIPRTALAPRLGLGESEAIALAFELVPYHLLIDDLTARRSAQSMNIPIIGTVGLLILARQRNLLPTIRPDLDALLEADFRISETLYHLALEQVGEQG